MKSTVFVLLAVFLVVGIGACDSSGSDCTAHHHHYCTENRLYWQDSCSEYEEQISICACGCSDDSLSCKAGCTDCTQDCGTRECGAVPNGCEVSGPTCGTCAEGFCNPLTGMCGDTCVPDCAGKECGSDGCDDSCGTCTQGKCNEESGICVEDDGSGLSIYQLQDSSQLGHPLPGTQVELIGVIVTAIASFGSSQGIWVQEIQGGPYSGIFAFKPENVSVDLNSFAEGDVVTVTGEYVEYYDLSEIVLGTMTRTGTRTPLLPQLVTDLQSQPERWEGVLIEVCGDCQVTALLDHGEAQTTCARIDDGIYDFFTSVGMSYACIRGLWHYSFSNYKLLPRGPLDLVGGQTLGDPCDSEPDEACGPAMRCVYKESTSAEAFCTHDVQGRMCSFHKFDSWEASSACDAAAGINDAGYYCDAHLEDDPYMVGVCRAGCYQHDDCQEDEFCLVEDPSWSPRGWCNETCQLFSSDCGQDQMCSLGWFWGLGEHHWYCTTEGLNETGESCSGNSCDADSICLSEYICRAFCDLNHPCPDINDRCVEIEDGNGSGLGASACIPLCNTMTCTELNRTVCLVVNGQPQCNCDEGFMLVQGECISDTPCDPNPCNQPHKSVCVAENLHAVCSCDPGYAEDHQGYCLDEDPCNPNPCNQHLKTICQADGFDYSCHCDEGAVAVQDDCLAGCPGGYHLEGDNFEPNECPEQARMLVQTLAGSYGIETNQATIAPTNDDLDYYLLTRQSQHVYWWLVSGESGICEGLEESIDPLVSTSWTHATQLAGASTDQTLHCLHPGGAIQTPSYGLAVIDFDVSDGDYPGGYGTYFSVPESRGWAANTLNTDSGDEDHFSFLAELPIFLGHRGQTVRVQVRVEDPSTGSLVASTEGICLQDLNSSSCVTITGSGVVKVEVDVTYSPEFFADTPSLTAYHFNW